MFMWRRRFPWPDIAALCSGDDHGCEKWLTESPGVRYAQKRDKIGFFSNVTTVLASLGPRGGPCGGLFGVRGTIVRRVTDPKTPEMARSPHNSGS